MDLLFSAQAKALARTRREAAEAGAALFAAESRGADRSGRGPGGSGGALAALLLTPQEQAAQADGRGDPVGLGLTQGGATTSAPARLLRPLAVATAPIRRFGEAQPGRGRSQGIAWTAPADAPVLAPADGEVEYAGPLRAWRLVVILRLDGGWRVVLAGLQRIDAPVGALLKAGQPLGRAPPAAQPPPELYMELRRGAEPVDPGPLLAKG